MKSIAYPDYIAYLIYMPASWRGNSVCGYEKREAVEEWKLVTGWGLPDFWRLPDQTAGHFARFAVFLKLGNQCLSRQHQAGD